MNIYVDIDNTICQTLGSDYENSTPIYINIEKINNLYESGHQITYYTARGSISKIDWYDMTKGQLSLWGCKYHNLSVGEKPAFDLLIDDRTKRIEEI